MSLPDGDAMVKRIVCWVMHRWRWWRRDLMDEWYYGKMIFCDKPGCGLTWSAR